MKKFSCMALALYIFISSSFLSVSANSEDIDKPVINFSIDNGTAVSQFEVITVTIDDASEVDVVLRLDGEEVKYIDVSSLSAGLHTAYVTATDKFSNRSDKSLIFKVTDDLSHVNVVEDEDITVSAKGDSTVYTGMLLADVHVLENRVGEDDREYLRCDNEQLISFNDIDEHITSAVGNSVPYQSFVINTEYSTDKVAVISYSGETGNCSDIALTAWNYLENRWDDIATVYSGESISIALDMEVYSYKKKMRVNAEPILNYNSDRIYWNKINADCYNIESVNNRKFDLISIGSHDMVIMYLGSHIDDETTSWANAVCSAYSNRNVLVVAENYFVSEYKYGTDAKYIWDEIIVPNTNIVAVLSNDFEGVFETVHIDEKSKRNIVEINADKSVAYSISFNDRDQMIVKALNNKYASYYNVFVYDLDLVESNRSIRTYEFHAVTDENEIDTVGEESISLGGTNIFYIKSEFDSKTGYSKIFVLDEYENNYNVDKPIPYPEVKGEKYVLNVYDNISENLYYGKVIKPQDNVVTKIVDLLPLATHVITFNKEVFEVGKEADFDKYNRLYFGVTTEKHSKWNIGITLSDGTVVDFANTKEIASQFGYENPIGYINGSFSGYVDLSGVIKGKQKISAIFLNSLTHDVNVSFEYAYIGDSVGKNIRFVTDENTAVCYEYAAGDIVKLPEAPYIEGYTFDGWYSEKNGGEAITTGFAAVEDTEVYARFSEKVIQKREIITSNKEINLERVSVWKIVFVCLCLVFMIVVIVVLRMKIKKSKNRSEN